MTTEITQAESLQGEVIVERCGGVMTISINRVAARNAINGAVARGIAEALDELDSDPDCLVGVVSGTGGHFSAGMDLKAFHAGERPAVEGRGFAGIAERSSAKPLIAAVEGFALAGGFEIALACDLLVASKAAIFGLPEVRRGLIASGGGLLRLPTKVPRGLAMEWALTGRMVTSMELSAALLVNRLVEPGESLATAQELAREIAANAPLAVVASKQIINDSASWAPDEAFHRQRDVAESIRRSRDAREGSAAFVEKRSPVWEAR
jgi:enoyl-CoA hydratase